MKSSIFGYVNLKDKNVMAVQQNCSFEKCIIFRINITVLNNVLERPEFRAGKSKGG